MYQPYPGAGQGPLPQQQIDPPKSVLTAVKLMYAGAALSAISLVIGLVTVSSLKRAIKIAGGPALTSSQINAAVDVTLALLIIFGLLGIGLWLWMAWANKGGRKWARITATVFFGLDTLGLLSAVARPHTLFALLLTVLVWLVGLGAIILLWNKESSAYIQAKSAPTGY